MPIEASLEFSKTEIRWKEKENFKTELQDQGSLDNVGLNYLEVLSIIWCRKTVISASQIGAGLVGVTTSMNKGIMTS